MFNAKRIFKDKTQPVKAVTSKDLRVSAFYQPSPVDDFLCSSHENAHCDESMRMTSDIYMLFNQQRLDKLSRAALVEHFDSMQVRDDSLRSLRSKMTDEQLVTMVKSRFIQSNSELLSWSRYINSLADSELQAYLSSLSKDTGKGKDVVEPENPVEPAPAPSE